MRLRTLLTSAGMGVAVLGCWIGLPGCNRDPADRAQPKVDTSTLESSIETSARAKPIAEAASSVFDFGTMEVGEQRSHEFNVRNVGSAKLAMTKGEKGCKCTSFEVDKLDLEPGESTGVKVTWKIEQVMESFEQYVALNTNDPEHPELRLTIKGAVAQLFQVKPSRIWRADPLVERVKMTGTIASSVLDTFEISKVESSDPLLTVKWKPLEETELNADEMKSAGIKCGYTLEADIAEGVPVGDFGATITIATTARDGASLSIDVVGNRPSVIRIFGQNWVQEHMMVSMGTFPTKAGKTVALTMFYTGEEELEFEEVVADPPYVKTTLERDTAFAGKGKSQKYKLMFEIPPGEGPATRNAGTGRGSVKVKTNVPEVTEINFLVSFVSTR